MSELHIAVTRDKPEILRTILNSTEPVPRDVIVHAIDSNGDQPAHIAARLNHVECMKVLIEYDAYLGRKNFKSLNPLGEAQMNGNNDIVSLIKDNYTTNASEESVWNDELEQETGAWHEIWDDGKRKMKWYRLGSNGEEIEISETPPPIDSIQRVIKARDLHHGKNMVRRIHPKSLPSMKQIEYDKQRRLEKERIKMILMSRARINEHNCATKLQSHWRKVKARLLVEQRLRESVFSTRIQRRFRRFIDCKKTKAITLIQSIVRKFLTMSYFQSYNRERLWWYRASRRLGLNVQRLWRGFKARSEYRQLYEMKRLPDPTDSRNYEFWKQCQRQAHPPKQEIGIFAQYTLSGTPWTWEERRVKRDGIFFRDVIFYANTITKSATWSKPKGWKFTDHRGYYALRLQTFWRARIAKRRIRLLTKSKLLLENAPTQDLDKATHDIVDLCNYTLYLHIVLHDYDRARKFYAKMLDFMNNRGVDNAFILYSCAIFGAVTIEEDWVVIKDYARRAKVADKMIQRRKNEVSEQVKSSYHVATWAFYYQSISNDHRAKSLHNYALCQMLVANDLEGARKSFIESLTLEPKDKHIVLNFNVLLQDQDFLGDASRNAYDEYHCSIKKH